VAQADKLERLLNLMAALLETHKPMTAAEIKRRVPGYPDSKESFRRSFERDKDDLREMGIPLLLEHVEGSNPPIEGYRIPKDQYYLRNPGLEPDELAALHLAASAVQLDGIEGVAGLWKLGGVPQQVAGGPGVDVAALPAGRNLVQLFEAVAARRPATFRYRDTERTVDPYRLDFHRGRWYLSGFDHVRGDERNFRLDRIEDDVRLGRARSFERPSTDVPGTRIEAWQLGEGEPVVARVLVDADQAPVALQQLGSDAVQDERADGSIVFALAVTSVPGFRSFVLGFLDHAEVLDPPELRAAVVDWLREIAA
jgi:proteasome accessory factor B